MDVLTPKRKTRDQEIFEGYSEATQRALKGVARRKIWYPAKPLVTAAAKEVDREWVMVPYKNGWVQVVIAPKGDGYVAWKL